jgi:hypothetical protein
MEARRRGRRGVRDQEIPAIRGCSAQVSLERAERFRADNFGRRRYRLRLREEVDVLKHLCEAAPNGCHPNVLSYIDSWEQDEALYIRTELCGLGNFARFLWEYGREFPRLDEARVWKIMVELSNVRRRLSLTLDFERALKFLVCLLRHATGLVVHP